MEKYRQKLTTSEPKIDFDAEVHKCTSLYINVLKAERYRHRNSSIAEWMERDKKHQDMQDNTLAPKGIICDACYFATTLIDKTLFDAFSDSQAYMVFMYECVSCKKRHAFLSDGSPWQHEREKCKKCGVVLKTKYTSNKKKGVSTITTYCPNCTYKEVDVINSKKDQEERELKAAQDKVRLQQYRKEFCLDDSTGPEYIRSIDAMMRFADELKKEEAKKQDPAFKKAQALSKLTISQLKNILSKTIANHGYTDLEFGKPIMGKHVVVEFTATDAQEGRGKYDSEKTMQKSVNTALINTNWRLMGEGVSYRLGILSGRLKAYEREEDLMEIVTKNGDHIKL